MANTEQPTAARGVSVLSKLRFSQISAAITDLVRDPEAAAALENRIKTIMKFDPAVSTNTPAQAQRVRAWREKQREQTGQSLYVITGQQRRYARQKAALGSANEK